LGIPSSEIETKWIFNIVKIFTSLHQCQLNVQNLDELVMILKNWPSDARTSCSFVVVMGMAKFLKVEDKMLDDFEKELEDFGYFDNSKWCAMSTLL